jgi:nucleoporin NUP160-like protein
VPEDLRDAGRNGVVGRGFADYQLQLWDLRAARCRRVITTAAAHTMWLSADGRTAVVASLDHAIRVWDLTTGQCTRTVIANAELITTLSVSEDLRLALSGEPGAVRLWDLMNGRWLRTFQGHCGAVGCVLLGADGESGLSIGEDKAARWWTWRSLVQFAAPPQLSRPRLAAELTRLGDRLDMLLGEATGAMSAGRYASAFDLLPPTGTKGPGSARDGQRGYHRRRRQGELGGLTGEGLAVGDGQQVGAQLGDLGWHLSSTQRS